MYRQSLLNKFMRNGYPGGLIQHESSENNDRPLGSLRPSSENSQHSDSHHTSTDHAELEKEALKELFFGCP